MDIPLGELQASHLNLLRQDAEYAWFPLGYDLYSFSDATSYRKILDGAARFNSLEILAFIGLWCGDTHDHFPALMRILDSVKFPRERLKILNLDRAKSFPGGSEVIAKSGITRLPTFVFVEEGRELGRITEQPVETLIADIARILYP